MEQLFPRAQKIPWVRKLKHSRWKCQRCVSWADGPGLVQRTLFLKPPPPKKNQHQKSPTHHKLTGSFASCEKEIISTLLALRMFKYSETRAVSYRLQRLSPKSQAKYLNISLSPWPVQILSVPQSSTWLWSCLTGTMSMASGTELFLQHKAHRSHSFLCFTQPRVSTEMSEAPDSLSLAIQMLNSIWIFSQAVTPDLFLMRSFSLTHPD